jgi:hypothetical protein
MGLQIYIYIYVLFKHEELRRSIFTTCALKMCSSNQKRIYRIKEQFTEICYFKNLSKRVV